MSSCIDDLSIIVAPKLIEIPIVQCYDYLHMYRTCALFSKSQCNAQLCKLIQATIKQNSFQEVSQQYC